MRNEIAQKNSLAALKNELGATNVQHIKGGEGNGNGGDRGGVPPKVGRMPLEVEMMLRGKR